MTRFLATALASAFLLWAGADSAMAGPIQNSDGSKTCNASGPSDSIADGVCANDLKTNEDLCDGGLSTEPGGGITCAESRAAGSNLRRFHQMQQPRAAAPAPRRLSTR